MSKLVGTKMVCCTDLEPVRHRGEWGGREGERERETRDKEGRKERKKEGDVGSRLEDTSESAHGRPSHGRPKSPPPHTHTLRYTHTKIHIYTHPNAFSHRALRENGCSARKRAAQNKKRKPKQEQNNVPRGYPDGVVLAHLD